MLRDYHNICLQQSHINSLTVSAWRIYNTVLPRNDYRMAVGYYNTSIFIIGMYNAIHMYRTNYVNVKCEILIY